MQRWDSRLSAQLSTYRSAMLAGPNSTPWLPRSLGHYAWWSRSRKLAEHHSVEPLRRGWARDLKPFTRFARRTSLLSLASKFIFPSSLISILSASLYLCVCKPLILADVATFCFSFASRLLSVCFGFGLRARALRSSFSTPLWIKRPSSRRSKNRSSNIGTERLNVWPCCFGRRSFKLLFQLAEFGRQCCITAHPCQAHHQCVDSKIICPS